MGKRIHKYQQSWLGSQVKTAHKHIQMQTQWRAVWYRVDRMAMLDEIHLSLYFYKMSDLATAVQQRHLSKV
jgi:hypothetical protein